MKTVMFGDLPPGCQVRGSLYLDPCIKYESGDVLEVELPTGLTIDVGWDDDSSDGPFRIAVYREYFGDRFVDFRVRNIEAVVNEVERLAREHSVSVRPGSSTPADTVETKPEITRRKTIRP